MSDETNKDMLAKALLGDIERALANGVKHFTVEGKPLGTAQEVLEALNRDGKIGIKQVDGEARHIAVPFQPVTFTIAESWENYKRCYSLCDGGDLVEIQTAFFTGAFVALNLIKKFADLGEPDKALALMAEADTWVLARAHALRQGRN